MAAGSAAGGGGAKAASGAGELPLARYREAAEVFQALRKRLPQESKRQIAWQLKHVPVDPRSANEKTAWPVIWDKPLYAKAEPKVADAWREQLKPYMHNAWMFWGKDARRCIIVQKGRGESSYRVEGKEAKAILASTEVPPSRLFAIQNGAQALRARTEASKRHQPVMDFWETPLEKLAPQLCREFGWGWSHATILHLLTDFGVAVRADRHQEQSLHHLGLWRRPDAPLTDRESVALAQHCRALARVMGELTTIGLRRIDFQLTHLSAHGVIG